MATGADTHAAEVPGLSEHAATIWTTHSMLDIRRRFADGRDRALRGEHKPAGRGALRPPQLAAGRDDICVPGDAGDFPIKQAFLAFLQAGTVADHIAADVTGKPFRAPFDPVSMCIMEMFDTATFAKTPPSGDVRRARRLRGARVVVRTPSSCRSRMCPRAARGTLIRGKEMPCRPRRSSARSSGLPSTWRRSSPAGTSA